MRDLVTVLSAGMRAKAAVTPTSFGTQISELSGVGFSISGPHEPFAGAWQRNIAADSLGQITSFGAVFACINRIATDIAKLRIMLMEQTPDGTWREFLGISPFWPVLRKPNGYQNRIQYLIAWLASKLIHGNTYVLKVRDARRVVVALHVLDPRRVTPLITATGDVYYQLSNDDLAQVDASTTVPASEIIHDRGLTLFHPLIGVSPLYACAFAATQGRRIQGDSAKFFENMSRPSGMLTAPGTIAQETADRIKRQWEDNFSGKNLGRLAVLGDGLKYEAMTIPPEQAQLVEQLGWTVEDVARAFGVPLYKINAGAVPTSNNVEALDQQYYAGTLQIYIESIELCLDEGLALNGQYRTQLDLDGLLRMDTATLVDSLSKAVGGAIMTPNEARAKLNQPPIAGGGSVYLQVQNYSLEALAKRDAKDDPFDTAKTEATPLAPPTAQADQAATKQAVVEAIESAYAADRETLSAAVDKATTPILARVEAIEAKNAETMASFLAAMEARAAESAERESESKATERAATSLTKAFTSRLREAPALVT